MKYTVLKLYGDGKWTEAAKVGDRDVAFACGQHISKQGFDVQIWERWKSKHPRNVHCFHKPESLAH
jgi:hypothetical protein